MIKLQSIKFPATWWDDDKRMQRREIVEFKLGMGPCGQDVTRLAIDTFSGRAVTIFQHHADGTYKAFMYQMRDIPGRIEFEYA